MEPPIVRRCPTSTHWPTPSRARTSPRTRPRRWPSTWPGIAANRPRTPDLPDLTPVAEMSHEPASPETIRVHTEKLLRRADAIDRWPTPVADILEASKLEEVDESPFSASVLGRAPEHLRHAVRLLKTGKVRAILDRRARVMHVDPSIDNEARRHFVALHEVTHDLLPWQRELGYADDDMTLSDNVNRTFEREANQGAAEMFFQGTRFTKMAANY